MTRAALIVLLLAAPAAAQIGPSNPGRATVRLEAEQPVVAPGQTTTVAVTFVIDWGWHIYWLNAGSTGEPTQLRFASKKGLTVGAPVWPGPKRYVQKALSSVDFVYEGKVTVLVPVTVHKDVAPGTRLDLVVLTKWFACDPESCVGGAGKQTLTLQVAAKPKPVDKKTKAGFDAYRKRLPAALPKGVTARFEGATLRIDAPKATSLTYFSFGPETCDPVDLLKDGAAKGATLRVRYPAGVAKVKQVKGLLALTRGKATTYHWLTVAPGKPTR